MDGKKEAKAKKGLSEVVIGLRYLRRNNYEQVVVVLEEVLSNPTDRAKADRLLRAVYKRLVSEQNPAKKNAFIDSVLNHRTVARQMIYQALLDGETAKASEWCEMLLERFPSDIEMLELASMTFRSLRNFDKAIAAANRLIELDPYNPEPYYNRGSLYLLASGAVDGRESKGAAEAEGPAAGDSIDQYLRMAGDDFNKAVELAPTDADAYVMRARMKTGLLQYQEALDDYARAIELDPEFIAAYNERAEVFVAINKYELAEKDYNRALEIDRYNLETLGQLGELYLIIANKSASKGSKAEAENAYKKAVEIYNVIISLTPGVPEAYVVRGGARANLGENEAALGDFSKALAMDSNYVEAYKARGETYSKTGKFDLALRDYDAAIKLAPDDPDGYVGRGNALVALIDCDKALLDFDRALQLNPGDIMGYRGRVFAHLSMGDYYRQRGMYEKMEVEYLAALADSNSALKLNPHDALVHWYMGLTLRSLESYDESVRSFDEAMGKLSNRPGDVATLRAERGEALRLWGFVLESKDKLEKSVGDFDTALRVLGEDMNSAWVYEAKGHALTTLERYGDALLAYDGALKVDPKYVWAHIWKGRAHYFLRDFDEARSAFETVLTLNEDEDLYPIWVGVGLGLTLEKLGEKNLAGESFAKTLVQSGGAEGFLNRAGIFEEFKEYGHALDDCREATLIAPEAAYAYNQLAWLIIEKMPDAAGLDEAIGHAHRAVTLEGEGTNRGFYLDTLGWGYYKKGDFESAVKYLQKASDLAPYRLVRRHHLQKAMQALKGSVAGIQ